MRNQLTQDDTLHIAHHSSTERQFELSGNGEGGLSVLLDVSMTLTQP